MATKGQLERNIIGWFTVNGAHVPIYQGETKEQAAKRHIDSVTKKNEQEKSAQLAKNKKEKESRNKKEEAEKDYKVQHGSHPALGDYTHVSDNANHWSARLMAKDNKFDVQTTHPYDDADRHWATGKMVKYRSNSVLAKIVYKGRVVEEKEFKYSGGDHAKTYKEIANYLDAKDREKGIKPRIDRT